MADLDLIEDTDESRLYNNEVKIEYTQLCKTNLSQKDFMTKQWVDIMIQRIVAAEEIVKASGYSTLHDSVKATLCTYLVENTKDNKKTLVLKPVPGKEHRSKTIIPLEQTYNIVRKAHISTKHGSCKEMEAWLANNNYTLNNMCCSIYIRCCKECSVTPFEQESIEEDIPDNSEPILVIPEDITSNFVPKVIDEDAFGHVCTVEVLDMSNNPDQYYHSLFVYEDRKTNFIQLRPMNTNMETEMSLELLKILTDFGSPECLVVNTDNIKIFEKILKLLETLTGCKVLLAFHRTESKLIQRVAKNIVKWMKERNCKNWGMGCHEVQWNMNNEPDNNGITPFSQVFGNQYTGFEYKSKFMPDNDNSDDDDYVINFDLDNDNDESKQKSTKSSTETKAPEQDFIPDIKTESVIKLESFEDEMLRSELNITKKLDSFQFDSDEG